MGERRRILQIGFDFLERPDNDESAKFVLRLQDGQLVDDEQRDKSNATVHRLPETFQSNILRRLAESNFRDEFARNRIYWKSDSEFELDVFFQLHAILQSCSRECKF
jgi:hypothetical protein